MTTAEDRKFKVDDLVWFLKSMRMCTVKEVLDDGYVVAVLDSGKCLFATETGIELVGQKAADEA